MLLSYTIAFLLEANSNSCITPSCTSAIPQPKRSHTVAIPYPYRIHTVCSGSYLPVFSQSPSDPLLVYMPKTGQNPNKSATKLLHSYYLLNARTYTTPLSSQKQAGLVEKTIRLV